MGGAASTPRGDVHPQEHGDYLLGVFVGEKAFDLSSRLWQRLLGLPLMLHWPEASVKEACENLAQNNTYTSHFAKLLIHLVWSLQEASSAAPGAHAVLLKATNGARFSCIFLKYFIENLKSDRLASCLSLRFSEKDAETTGFPKGEQNVLGFVVPALLDFVGNSDTNPTTYLLHLEAVNLLLVMMSTQLHSAASSVPKDAHPFLDTAMLQESRLVGPFVRKLLLSYVSKLPIPADAAPYITKSNQRGVFRRVGSAAATVFLFPYYTYSYLVGPSGTMAKSPLAENSLLLLLALIHYRKSTPVDGSVEKKTGINAEDIATAIESLCFHLNPFCQALETARDTQFDLVDVEGNCQGLFSVRIPFAALYDTLGLSVMDEGSILLLYSLVHGNSSFLEYVLVRTDLDTLLMPVLEMLYNAPRKTPNQIYMLLIILLILSQDSSFNASIHKLILQSVPWYKERLLTQTSLGSLVVVILIRTVKYNLSKLKDVYLHTNCLATLANMAPHVHRLDAYAAQRLVSLFDMLARKYTKLVQASNVAKRPSIKENELAGLETSDEVATELHIYTDFLRIVLEIINAILTYALPRNPEVVYALLHRQELFEPFRNHPRFYELVENIYTVMDFFNVRMDAQHTDGEWSVEKVLEVIISTARSWRGEGLKMFTQLRFTYEEERHPEEFFIPYVWQLVVSHSGINWDLETVSLFPVKPSLERDAFDGDMNEKGFEVPLTPHVEV